MKRIRNLGLILPVVALILVSLACEMPSQEVASDLGAIATQTMQALATTVAAAQAAGDASPEQGGEGSPPDEEAAPAGEPSPTPTMTLTPTAAPPMVSVSMDTNCRFGPGDVYDYLGALMVGEEAQVVGKLSDESFWYIENPDAPPPYCWVWGNYATVQGDTSQVPVLTPPPTPTPEPTSTNTPIPVDFDVGTPTQMICGASNFILFTIENTGPTSLESYEVTGELDTSETRYRAGDTFGSHPHCAAGPVALIAPGETYYIALGSYAVPPLGHIVEVTLKICSQDGGAGVCVTKSMTSTVVSVSDEDLKERIVEIDAQEILARLMGLPISSWNYEWEDDGVRHIGPMAQDFYKAFGYGEDDRYISAVDSNGVAFAAIQAMYQKLQERDAQMEALTDRLENLEDQVASAGSEVTNLNLPAAGLSFLCGMLVGAFILSTHWRKNSTD